MLKKLLISTLWLMLVATVLVDATFTAYALTLGIVEANPVADVIIKVGGIPTLMAVKGLLLIFIVLYTPVIENRPAILALLGIVALSYTGVTILHIHYL